MDVMLKKIHHCSEFLVADDARKKFMNDLNEIQVIEKPMTRQEYYTNMGFSGSKIDRPDEPVDDEFKKHCEGLRQIAEAFNVENNQ